MRLGLLYYAQYNYDFERATIATTNSDEGEWHVKYVYRYVPVVVVDPTGTITIRTGTGTGIIPVVPVHSLPIV